MLRRVALVRTDVSEELCASIIRVTRIGDLGTTLHFVFLHSVRRLLVTDNVILQYQMDLNQHISVLSGNYDAYNIFTALTAIKHCFVLPLCAGRPGSC
jgi:hypothetical protein